MKEPTEEQRNEVWKWCGLKKGKTGFNASYYTEPGTRYYTIPEWELNLDLNNLFKYAVPRVYPESITFDYTKPLLRCTIKCFQHSVVGEGDTEALALFAAIYVEQQVGVE